MVDEGRKRILTVAFLSFLSSAAALSCLNTCFGDCSGDCDSVCGSSLDYNSLTFRVPGFFRQVCDDDFDKCLMLEFSALAPDGSSLEISIPAGCSSDYEFDDSELFYWHRNLGLSFFQCNEEDFCNLAPIKGKEKCNGNCKMNKNQFEKTFELNQVRGDESNCVEIGFTEVTCELNGTKCDFTIAPTTNCLVSSNDPDANSKSKLENFPLVEVASAGAGGFVLLVILIFLATKFWRSSKLTDAILILESPTENTQNQNQNVTDIENNNPPPTNPRTQPTEESELEFFARKENEVEDEEEEKKKEREDTTKVAAIFFTDFLNNNNDDSNVLN